MSVYQARITDRQGRLISIVPAQLSYSRMLNGDGSCTLTIPLDHPSIADPSVLVCWAREILLLRQDTPTDPWTVAHDGPITQVTFDPIAGTATVTSGTVKAWLTKRLGGQYFYLVNADLATIADLIITRAQDRGPTNPDPNADLSIMHSVFLTGVTRLFNTNGQGARKYSEILDEYATALPGFDYDITTTLDASGARLRTFQLFYPTRGNKIATPLTLGSTLTSLQAVDDGDRAVTHFTTFGYGSGTQQKVGVANDNITSLTTGRLEAVDTRTDVNDQQRLNDLAAEQLRLRRPPVRVLSGGYRVAPATPWRFATLGDTVPIRATRGPLQINDTRRIVAEQITVNDGSEDVALTFNDPVPA